MEMESKLQSEGKDLRAALREKETVISKLKDEAAKTQNLLDQANGKVCITCYHEYLCFEKNAINLFICYFPQVNIIFLD